MKVVIAVVVVVVIVLGLLLTLRTSRDAGMPGADVIERARKRAREQEAADKDD